MAVFERLKIGIILKSLGIETKYIDVSQSIAANTTDTVVSYNPPSGYAWINVDARFGPHPNRLLKLNIKFDNSIEMSGVQLGSTLINESWRPILEGVVYNELTVSVENTDSSAHDIDMLLRGFLIRNEKIPTLLREFRLVVLDESTTINLSDETINKLSIAIADKLGGVIPGPSPTKEVTIDSLEVTPA